MLLLCPALGCGGKKATEKPSTPADAAQAARAIPPVARTGPDSGVRKPASAWSPLFLRAECRGERVLVQDQDRTAWIEARGYAAQAALVPLTTSATDWGIFVYVDRNKGSYGGLGPGDTMGFLVKRPDGTGGAAKKLWQGPIESGSRSPPGRRGSLVRSSYETRLRLLDLDRDGRLDLAVYELGTHASDITERSYKYHALRGTPTGFVRAGRTLDRAAPKRGFIRRSVQSRPVRTIQRTLGAKRFVVLAAADTAGGNFDIGDRVLGVGTDVAYLVLVPGKTPAGTGTAHLVILRAFMEKPRVLASVVLGPAVEADKTAQTCRNAFRRRADIRSTHWDVPGRIRALVATWHKDPATLVGLALRWDGKGLQPAGQTALLETCGGAAFDLSVEVRQGRAPHVRKLPLDKRQARLWWQPLTRVSDPRVK